MTIAALGAFASAARSAASTSYAVVTSATLNVGELAVLIIAGDNHANSAGGGGFPDFRYVSTINDPSSNAWTCAGFWNELSAAGAGVGLTIWYCEVETAVASGSSLTINFAGSSVTAAAVTGYRFSRDTTKHCVSEGAKHLYASADPAALQLTGLESREHLVIRSVGGETSVATWTSTATFTPFDHSASTSATGASTANIGARGEFKIETGTSSTSSDPTWTSAECASLMVAFAEISVGVRESNIAGSNIALMTGTASYSVGHGNGGTRGIVIATSGSAAAVSATVFSSSATLQGSADNGVVGTGSAICSLLTHTLAAGVSTAPFSSLATVTFAANTDAVVATMSLMDVDPATPFGSIVTATSATSTAPSITASAGTSDLLCFALATGKQAAMPSSNGFPNASVSQRECESFTSRSLAIGVMAGNTASLSPSWASANGLGWAMAAIEVNGLGPVADTLFGQACL